MGVAVGFVISAWSCSSTKPDLQLAQDPSFTPTTLRQGQIVVAGVTLKAGNEVERASVRNPFAGLLASALEVELHGMRVMPVDVARSRLGRIRHARLLADLEETGRISTAAIAQLDSTIGAEVHYAVVARIDSDLVERDESTTTPNYAAEDYEEGDPQRSTTRTVNVSFLVYELSSGRVMWDEQIRGTIERTATGSWTKKKTTYPLYPKVPKLYLAFDDACWTLARHLANTPRD
jgi:hypothetical protein